MLHRVIYASEAVGATGASTLSIAQILGVSLRNNLRSDLTSCVMFHDGHILQAIEGKRSDVDRLLRALLTDHRHTGVKILVDSLIPERRLVEPMVLCGDPAALLAKLGLHCLSSVTAREAEVLLEFRKAA